MSTQPPSSTYTEDEERGARLNFLLCDDATRACRHVFHQKLGHPENPLDLCQYFSDPGTYRILRNLKKPRGRVITEEQWNLLFPPVPLLPDSRSFDITLWCVLLRSICKLPTPSNGWDKDPNPSDNSLSADLVRLRLYRNRFRGHITSTSISKAEFNTYWKKVETILVALGLPKVDIDRRKTESLDPNLFAKHIKLLKDLDDLEDLMDKEIEVIKKRQQEFEQETERAQRNLNDSISRLCANLQSHTNEQSNIRLKVNEHSTRFETLQRDLSEHFERTERAQLNASDSIDRLRVDFELHTNEQSSLRLEINEYSARFETLQTDLSEQSEKTERGQLNISDSINRLRVDLESHTNKQSDTRLKVNENSAYLEILEKDLSEQSVNIDALRGRLNLFAVRLGDVTQSFVVCFPVGRKQKPFLGKSYVAV